MFVIPVKTGIQSFQMVKRSWIPAFAGMTNFLRVIIIDIFHQNLLTSNSYKYTDNVIVGSGSASEKRLIIMGTEKRYCSICAWRENCTKRFTVSTDSSGHVHCPDYTRDFTIKEKDIDEAEKKSRSES